ncbi:MAG: DUF2933 domain-containing protein [Actinomycetota bacterium]|nr:DUF2933 domain-containing protein [Actinomycetota bacterium]
MIAYWPWLLFLACPLMMMFMMRGMGRGDGGTHRTGRDALMPGGELARPTAARPLTAEEQTRIAQLERDLAQLLAGGDRTPGDTPTSTR